MIREPKVCRDCPAVLADHRKMRCHPCQVQRHLALETARGRRAPRPEQPSNPCQDCAAPTHRGLRAKRCINCETVFRREYRNRWAAAHSEEQRAYARQWRADNPERRKASGRKGQRRRYGILNPTGEQPSGPCEICKRPTEKLHCDHNHATGLFRGWLCSPCNRALGFFYDDPVRMRRAARYVAPIVDAVID